MFIASQPQTKAGIPKSLFSQLFHILLLFSSLCVLPGCGGDKDASAWSNFKPLNEIDKHIEGYYEASVEMTDSPKIDSPAIYVDFSNGLLQAFKSSNTNKTMIRNVAEQFGSRNNIWWGLGKDKYSGMKRLVENSSNDLKAKIDNVSSYDDIYAPIKTCLEKITSSSNDALLITDFEEYRNDNTENVLDFASEYFIDWIKKGNTITFEYNSFHEGNSNIADDKNLYFIFFTHGEKTTESLISQFKQSLQNTGVYPKTFELNSNPYSVSNNYDGTSNTAVANKAFEKWVNANKKGLQNGNLPYEFIGVNKPWDESLGKYVTNIIDNENGIFLSRLSLNAADTDCYKLRKVNIKVYDVSDDYENYARCQEARKHPPVLTKNQKKDNVWDENSKKDPITKECYIANTIDIKKEWLYKPAELSSKEWPELFDYDQSLFAAHLKNTPADISLNTVFHSDYKMKVIKKKDALLRVDYVIEDVIPNIENPKFSALSWLSVIKKENGKNESLYSAIKRTLQNPAINPKGKILYSYYIKFANKKSSENN